MIKDNDTETVAAVCDKQEDLANAMKSYLDTHNISVSTWFTPLGLDDLDEEVREGRIRHVVFTDLTGLLDGIWDGDINFDEWLTKGVGLDFVDSPAATPESTGKLVFESWHQWNQRRSRRQAVAGFLISAIALAAGFTLNLLVT